MNDKLFTELHAIAQTWAENSGGRMRVAKNEANTTTEFDPEAQEHLKMDERRMGRDFRLYAFMADVAGVQHAVADFAELAMGVKVNMPAAFSASRPAMEALGDYFPEERRPDWKALWQ